MNRRKAGLAVLLGPLVFGVAPLASVAQRMGKTPRVGILVLGETNAGSVDPNLAAFEEALRALGWEHGRNVLLERRNAEGHPERYPSLARELVRLRVDVILPAGGPASLQAAKDATKDIPIVMVASSRDPVRDGMVKSFARPTGNITGIVTIPAEGGGKLFELLKEIMPAISRVGVIWDATISPYRVAEEMGSAARSLGIELVGFEVRDLADVERAIGDAAKAPVDGLIVASTPMTGKYRREIAEQITAHRLPAIALFRNQAEAGLLATYGPSIKDEFRSAALYVDKILKGANPGDLPVEQPTKFELVLNMRTARAIGRTIPQSLLLRADEVID
jgi:putative ABC transport system substrate-binding protein